MKKVQNLLKIKPELKKINLSFLQIETLDDIMFELIHFQNLQEIDLSCNRLTSLPKDMSVLKNIKRIDLSHNIFNNQEKVLSSICTMA